MIPIFYLHKIISSRGGYSLPNGGGYERAIFSAKISSGEDILIDIEVSESDYLNILGKYIASQVWLPLQINNNQEAAKNNQPLILHRKEGEFYTEHNGNKIQKYAVNYKGLHVYIGSISVEIEKYLESQWIKSKSIVIQDPGMNDFEVRTIGEYKICDTPEELLIIQAAKEGKTMTLEQAREISKDWHFGGVR